MKGFAIVLNRCPHGVEMISLDNPSGGTRIAGPGCCGRWTVVKEWSIDAATLRAAAEEADCYEEIADAGKGEK